MDFTTELDALNHLAGQLETLIRLVKVGVAASGLTLGVLLGFALFNLVALGGPFLWWKR